MKTIVFNHASSQLAQVGESVLFRAGYILADRVASAGSTFIDLYFIRDFKQHSFSNKLSLFEKINQDEEGKALVQKIKAGLNKYAKIKHKTAQHIVAYKKLEQVVHNNCVAAFNEFEKSLEKCGLVELRKLADEDAVSAYHMLGNREEGQMDNNTIYASTLMQRLLPNLEEGPEIFFLSPEFFSDKGFAEKYKTFTPGNAAAADKQNLFLHSCFTLPNLNSLSAPELKAIRNKLHAPGTAFRKCADTWMGMCYADAPGADRVAFFNEQLLPAAGTLQLSINENEILQHASFLQKGSVKTEVMCGEMPLSLLWDYYRYFGVLGNETWDKLEAIKLKGGIEGLRWPVMILLVPQTLLDSVTPVPGSSETITVKRSIAID